MKRCCIALFLLPLFTLGQIDESDTLNLKASLAVSGFFQDGNVQTLIFRTRADLGVKTLKKWVFKTQNSYVYQAFGGDKADEDILSLNFLYFNPDRKVYPLALGIVSTNFRREIDIRYLMGVGGTYQILRKQKNWLKVSLSTEYERTNFAQDRFNLSEYNGMPSINTFRGTVWLNGKYHLFKNKVIIGHESYFQPSLQQANNYRWKVDVSLGFPIWKFLTFNIQYIHTFESLVIAGQLQRDRFLTIGVTLKNF